MCELLKLAVTCFLMNLRRCGLKNERRVHRNNYFVRLTKRAERLMLRSCEELSPKPA